MSWLKWVVQSVICTLHYFCLDYSCESGLKTSQSLFTFFKTYQRSGHCKADLENSDLAELMNSNLLHMNFTLKLHCNMFSFLLMRLNV